MIARNWSIETELCRLASETSVPAALLKLGLLPRGAARNSFVLREVRNWERSGAETYSYVFTVSNPYLSEFHYRLKACVAVGLSVDQILVAWIARRNILANAGVSVPTLFGHGTGVILEEEVPLIAKVALKSDMQDKVLAQLLNIAIVIARLRFAPISAFSDIGSRGTDAVYIDFGSDLGPPHRPDSRPSAIFKQLSDQLFKWGVPLAHGRLEKMREAFYSATAATLH